MTDAAVAFAAVLFAGHMTGDFVLQTNWMVRHKTRPAGLFAHVGVVALAHAVFLLPFASASAAVALGAIVVAHILIDVAKTAGIASAPRFARTWFWLDQAAHGAVLAAAVWLLGPSIRFLDAVALDPHFVTRVGVLVGVYAFNVRGVSALVEFELARLGIALSDQGPAAGRTIGVLERVFAITLILLDRWEALGFLVAAKSLARFKDLDDRTRAEYYLVGTLVSLLAATVSVLAARAVLSHVGA